MERRHFLTGAGVAGASAVLAACAGGSLTPDHAENADMAGVPTNRVARLGTHRIIWSARVDEPLVALSFDDGPDPALTPRVLDVLANHGVRATFCMMGWNVAHHPELARRVVAAGHEVANHSWSHLDLAHEPEATVRTEIARAKSVIESVTGQRTRYYRPARGELPGAAARIAAELDYDVLLWTLLGDVAGTERPTQVSAFVGPQLQPGTIVDFHDGIGRGTFEPHSANAKALLARRNAEIAALPQMISNGQAHGVRFVTVSELLASADTVRPPAAQPR